MLPGDRLGAWEYAKAVSQMSVFFPVSPFDTLSVSTLDYDWWNLNSFFGGGRGPNIAERP